MDIAAVMTQYYPGAQWKCGETYDSLVMLDTTPKPLRADLESKWADYLAAKRRNRRFEHVAGDVEAWLASATAAQRDRAFAWALAANAFAMKNLAALQSLTGVDPTEPDT